MAKKKSLVNYLIAYQSIQEYIFLVSHPTNEHNWADRCIYGTAKYNPHKHYNHRAILRNEVVIEYDFEDEAKNRDLVMKINKKLISHGLATSLWFSGGKSYHLHTHIDIPKGVTPREYKKTFMFWASEGLPRPDMLTAGDNHLIRAENGLHESSRRHKTLCTETPDYPRMTNVEDLIRQRYDDYQEYLEGLPEPTNKLLETPEVQLLLDTKRFKDYNDGVQRALFILTHVLKETMTKEETKSFLKKWYRAVGGYKTKISSHVDYQWDKKYYVIGHLKDLVFDLRQRES